MCTRPAPLQKVKTLALRVHEVKDLGGLEGEPLARRVQEVKDLALRPRQISVA